MFARMFVFLPLIIAGLSFWESLHFVGKSN